MRRRTTRREPTGRKEFAISTPVPPPPSDRDLPSQLSDLQQALELQKLLTREVDHRAKNNFQMVGAMLMLQAMAVEDGAVRRALHDVLRRIDALGLVHQRFHERSSIESFDLAAFTKDLVGAVMAARGSAGIAVDLRLQPVFIPSAVAAVVALIINEALTNALKHGLGDRPGRLTVTMTERAKRVSVQVADDGPGLPVGQARQRGFGTTLVETLGAQIGASFDWRNTSPGLLFTFDFPNGDNGDP